MEWKWNLKYSGTFLLLLHSDSLNSPKIVKSMLSVLFFFFFFLMWTLYVSSVWNKWKLVRDGCILLLEDREQTNYRRKKCEWYEWSGQRKATVIEIKTHGPTGMDFSDITNWITGYSWQRWFWNMIIVCANKIMKFGFFRVPVYKPHIVTKLLIFVFRCCACLYIEHIYVYMNIKMAIYSEADANRTMLT